MATSSPAVEPTVHIRPPSDAVATVIRSDEVVSASQDDTVDSASTRRSLLRVTTVAPAVLVLLIVVAIAVAVVGQTVRDDGVQATPQWKAFVDAGSATAQALTTIDHRNAQADTQRIIDGATGAFRTDFVQRREPFIATVREAQSVSVGTVTASALESFTDNERATVLIAVTVKTTKASEPEQEPRLWRMRITVVREQGELKAQNVEFVP